MDHAKETPATLAGSAFSKVSLEDSLSSPSAMAPISLLKQSPSSLSSNPPKTPFPGTGTFSNPFIVDYLPSDPLNPYNWPKTKRWGVTMLIGVTALCPPFASVSYSATLGDVVDDFGISRELATAGISLFIAGFGFGPLIWAPLSEIYGRVPAFLFSYPIFTLFNLGTALSHSTAPLMVTRFWAGFFGGVTLTNSGAQIGDMWAVWERAVATSIFALAPFLGPVAGPIVGGYVAEKCGYRWVYWIQFIFAAVMTVLCIIFIPETYAPTILRREAIRLQNVAQEEGRDEHFISKYDIERKSKREIIQIGLHRPFQMLFTEIIVACLSVYGALIYGILYLFFTAFPIVFQQTRHWSIGQSGLAFLGMGVGLMAGVAINPSISAYFYTRSHLIDGRPPPESRLPVCCIGAILAPLGLFWFAWTSAPPVHYIVSIIACIPFGLAFLLIFTSMTNYLIDSYELYAASALAAQAVSRCLFGAIFPLFAKYMYEGMGLHWAGTLVAFLALACTPLPFLFYRYGAFLRRRSRYAPSTSIVVPSSHDEEKGEEKEEEGLSKVRSRGEEGLEPEWARDAGEGAGREKRSVEV
ncbi:multidrug transporter [Cryptococcus wingfieldii CBS 7118]|uniref:Multidrug transporter n=1 Tax=Cryptococcus wingfieldii CBS 7118 TaxID=1295528 RepID=A0A1E3K6Y1_9TREE|nr:multidrug transporter [Cryptococcus wingfieldii CBS 7118]ODO08297.1 multidrug transporter [Cryptococcus wingfieldii CBS 7118]